MLRIMEILDEGGRVTRHSPYPSTPRLAVTTWATNPGTPDEERSREIHDRLAAAAGVKVDNKQGFEIEYDSSRFWVVFKDCVTSLAMDCVPMDGQEQPEVRA